MMPPAMRPINIAKAILIVKDVSAVAKVVIAAMVNTDVPNTIQPIPLQPIFASFFLLGPKMANASPTKIRKVAKISAMPALARKKNKKVNNIGSIPLSIKFLLYYTIIYIKKQIL